MNNKFSFYLERDNKLFNGNTLAICYKADEDEIKEFGLTSPNIILFIKNEKLKKIIGNNDCNYLEEIRNIFQNEKIILRLQCECFLGMYGDSHCDCEKQRIEAIKIIAEKGGIFIHLPQEAQGWGLHYKLKELDLQVSGRMPNGEFVGQKDRDTAQKKLLNVPSFSDNRSYKIVVKLLKELGLIENQFLIITDSDKKIKNLQENEILAIKYSDYCEKEVNSNNVSEYLAKIYNVTHNYDRETIDNIIKIIEERNYNERTLEMLINIVDKIKQDETYALDKKLKKRFLDLYNEIVCGEEKRYIIGDGKYVKVQNNFSCKVNSTIFKTLCKIYGKNIFDRICLEKIYYFQDTLSELVVRIRTSKILDCVEESCTMFNGQMYTEQSTYDEKKKRVIQKEISVSSLRSYFENPQYSYIKRVEMVTIISEGILPGVNIYIKKIPNTQNRVMDIYGKKEKIKELIDNIISINNRTLLNIVNDKDLSEQNFSKYNLRFADLNSVIDEELGMYTLTKEEEKNGVRSKILLPEDRT